MSVGNKVNEWQELSLKKDIEKILKYLKERRTLEFTFTIDLTIALAAFFLDLIDKNLFVKYIIIVLMCISLGITLGITIINYGKIIKNTFINKYRTYNSFSKEELVDLFDNDICYCIMTANSYYEMLKSLLPSEGENNNLFRFYYIETWYYINKAKYQLQRMIYKEKDIFTKDPSQIVNKNMISISRLINLIRLIDSLQISIEELRKNNSPSIDNDTSLQSIHILYDNNYLDFINKIIDSFELTDIKITKVEDL